MGGGWKNERKDGREEGGLNNIFGTRAKSREGYLQEVRSGTVRRWRTSS